MTVRIVHIPADPGAAAEWLADSAAAGSPFPGDQTRDPENNPEGGPGGGETARTVLILPGESVVGHSLHLPGPDAQARAAAAFAVEDELAADVSTLHLAIAPPSAQAGGARLVAVAARDVMDRALSAAASLGAVPDAATPEWAAVPAAPGELGIVVVQGLAHVNAGGAWGFSADADLAALLIARALERVDTGRVTIWGDSGAVTPPDGWGGREVVTHKLLDPRGALGVFARGAQAASLNLLQGAYAPRRRRRLDFSLWRRAAMLAAALFAGWLALTAAEAAALHRRAGALETEARAVFAQAFPDEPRVVNPGVQMQTRLTQLRGQGGEAFLDLAALLAAAVAATDGVEIDALRYDRAQGALGAELAMADYALVQTLRNAVADSGGILEEGASRQADGRVAADVTVRLP